MFFCTSSLWSKIMYSNKVQFFNPLTLLGPTKCGQRRWLFWHGVGSKSAGRSCQELLGSCRESREVLCCQGSLETSQRDPGLFPSRHSQAVSCSRFLSKHGRSWNPGRSSLWLSTMRLRTNMKTRAVVKSSWIPQTGWRLWRLWRWWDGDRMR